MEWVKYMSMVMIGEPRRGGEGKKSKYHLSWKDLAGLRPDITPVLLITEAVLLHVEVLKDDTNFPPPPSGCQNKMQPQLRVTESGT